MTVVTVLMIWCSCSSHARKIHNPTDHWRQETVRSNSTKRTFQQKNKPTTPTSPIAFMTFLVNMKHVEIHGVLPTNLNLQKKTEDGLGLLVIWVLALGLDFVVEEREARHPLWWHPPDRGWEPSTCYDHRYPPVITTLPLLTWVHLKMMVSKFGIPGFSQGAIFRVPC